MFKPPNTDSSGRPFSPETVEAVWKKAVACREHPPLRLDPYGALIWREGYGNWNSRFGWVIGYKERLANGRGDDLENLIPVQWENNRRNGSS